MTRKAFLASLNRDEAAALCRDWRFWARPDQRPPEGAWAVWLFLGGRGAGKTRAGAEFIAGEALSGRAGRIALVGETLIEARQVMVEGASGLLHVMDEKRRPRFLPSRRRLEWPNGAVAQLYSGDDPESLRGPQHALAWCDEYAKWRAPQETLDTLQMGLRLGEQPRAMITTTPRNVAALKALMADPLTAVTRARTRDNAANLPKRFLQRMAAAYDGTRLGRQELDAELLEDDANALWRRAWIDAARVRNAPALARVICAVDPPVTSGPNADACGIVVAGEADGEIYILADRTVQGLSPAQWAQHAARAAAAYGAEAIAVECNQGGELVSGLLRNAAPDQRVVSVTARLGKQLRAQPVALLYEQGRVHHVGALAALEDEMCLFGGGMPPGKSPDRVDALVWAVTQLTARLHAAEPRLRRL